MKKTLKKDEIGRKAITMRTEEILIDQEGHKKVLLDFEEYVRLKKLAKAEKPKRTDFTSLLGAALKAPLNPNPRFKTEDDFWEGMP